jgi:acyl-CoA synthetase (AMP-forming)/AMP-acid ligase II
MLSGRNLGLALATMHYDLEMDEASVAMAPIPYFHVSGFGLAMVAAVNGAALLLEHATTPGELRDLLIERRVSHAALVPTLLQRLVALPGVGDRDWSSLKYVVYGGVTDPAARDPPGHRTDRLPVPAELRAHRVHRRRHGAAARALQVPRRGVLHRSAPPQRQRQAVEESSSRGAPARSGLT